MPGDGLEDVWFVLARTFPCGMLGELTSESSVCLMDFCFMCSVDCGMMIAMKFCVTRSAVRQKLCKQYFVKLS